MTILDFSKLTLLFLATSLTIWGADPTPFGLQPAAPVEQWQSGDTRAQQVQALFSPYFSNGQFNTSTFNWSGTGGFRNMVHEITPSNPTTNPFHIVGPQDGGQLRVYFLDETAGYQNTLGIVQSTDSSGPNPLEVSPTQNVLVFPNASRNTNFSRSESAPLKPMDYVDLGWINEGDLFELFLIAQGGSGDYDQSSINFSNPSEMPAEGIFFSDPNHNLPEDDLTLHFRIYEIEGYSNYLLFRTEDLVYGGDNNYRDLYFLVEIAVPEPPTYLLLGGLLLLFFMLNRQIHFRKAS